MTSENQLSRDVSQRNAPPFTSDPRDEYLYSLVRWLLTAIGCVLMFGGFAVVLVALVIVGDHGGVRWF